MWFEYLGTLFSKIGAKLAAALAAVVAVLLMILGHRRKVDKARKEGRKTGQDVERERIARETVKEQMTAKETTSEIRQKYADLDDDELLRRMRNAATDKGDR